MASVLCSVLTPFVSDDVGNVFLCISDALNEFGGTKISNAVIPYEDAMYMESRVRTIGGEKFENFKNYILLRYPECKVLMLEH